MTGVVKESLGTVKEGVKVSDMWKICDDDLLVHDIGIQIPFEALGLSAPVA